MLSLSPKERFELNFREVVDIPDSDLLADFLRSKGVKGKKQMPRYCPLANYLSHDFDDDNYGAVVDPTEISLSRRIGTSQGRELGFSLVYAKEPSEAMYEFITKFDRGEYPDLIQ